MSSQSEHDTDRGVGFDLHTVWKQYEDVAVHFNDLILRLRFQALGGVAALSALVGIVLKDNIAVSSRWSVLAVAFGVLCVFWVALAVLDIFYYNRLLLGAVEAILALEDISRTQRTCDRLNLSGEIKRTVEGGGARRWGPSLRGPLWFYGIVLAALLAMVGLSLSQADLGPKGARGGSKVNVELDAPNSGQVEPGGR